MSCEWSTGPARQYSHLSARLAGYDGVACSHILHAIMAQVSDALETYERGLKTRDPSYIGMLAVPFFIHEARDP
jgi:hypothetical protein